jgi:SAM-dependent methyltransferase
VRDGRCRHTIARDASSRRQRRPRNPCQQAIEANVEIKLPSRRRPASLDDMGRYALAQRLDSQHMRTIRRLLDPQPGTRILEVGSGRGHLTCQLDQLGTIATGVDANPAVAKHALARDIRVMNVERLDFADAEFDQVVSVHAIEHFPNLAAGFAEMARVLRPGGRMLLVYPWEPIRGVGAVPDAITIYRNPFRARQMHLQKPRPRMVRKLADDVGLAHVHTEFKIFWPQFTTLLHKAGEETPTAAIS